MISIMFSFSCCQQLFCEQSLRDPAHDLLRDFPLDADLDLRPPDFDLDRLLRDLERDRPLLDLDRDRDLLESDLLLLRGFPPRLSFTILMALPFSSFPSNFSITFLTSL